MKECVCFRINNQYLDIIQEKIPLVEINPTHPYIVLPTNDKNVSLIHQMNQQLDNKLYYYWDLLFEYTEEDLKEASLFRVSFLNVVDSCGEEGGTKFDYSTACPLCGSGRRQIGDLHLLSNVSLKENTVYKTIGGEIIVPSFIRDVAIEYGLQGLIFLPVWVGKTISPDYLQLTTTSIIDISPKTRFGVDFFDTDNITSMSEESFEICGYKINLPKEIYVCPNKDLVGFRLLSELSVFHNHYKEQCDFMKTAQYVGVKRGLINPEPLYVCSKKWFNAMEKTHIQGMGFEIVKVSEK